MKSIDARSNEYIDKIAEAKVEYQNRETECKQMKTRINELKASIEAMKIEYDESKDILADLVVNNKTLAFPFYLQPEPIRRTHSLCT
jgi:hypothetical protein